MGENQVRTVDINDLAAIHNQSGNNKKKREMFEK